MEKQDKLKETRKMTNQKQRDNETLLTYPAGEDIYNKATEEENIDPETGKKKISNQKGTDGEMNEKDFEDDLSGDDLDIPGSELDDDMEAIGSEDEENNYYSIGGDNHNDLEEDKGE